MREVTYSTNDRQNTQKNSSLGFILSFIADWYIISPDSKNKKNKSRFFYFAIPPTHKNGLRLAPNNQLCVA